MDTLAGKRILVTGATGFIGGHLARRLHAEGAHVLALARTPSKGRPLAELGIEVVQSDITNHGRMTKILGQDMQIVMHLAAWRGLRGKPLRDVEHINVTATRHLAQVAAEAGVERFIFTSSIAVYGIRGDADVDETTPIKPYRDLYGDSKIGAERALRQVAEETGLVYVILRPGQVYGPGSSLWTTRLVMEAKKGQLPFINSGRGSVHPIYVDNLVDLLLLCALHPDAVGQTFNAADDGPVTWADFFGAYMRMVPTERAIHLPLWAARLGALLANPFTRYNLRYLVEYMCGQGEISNRKAKDLLGWSPRVSLEEGMSRCQEWLRAESLF